MFCYLVIRHGSNRANQSMTPAAIVGTVEGCSKEAAKVKALAKFNTYNNQYLELRAISRCSQAECQTAWEADLAHEADEKHLAAIAAEFSGEQK